MKTPINWGWDGACHFKFPIGATIHNPFNPDLRGVVVGHLYQANDETLNQTEGKLCMIKTETGAVSELEFIFEDDAELFGEPEEKTAS